MKRTGRESTTPGSPSLRSGDTGRCARPRSLRFLGKGWATHAALLLVQIAFASQSVEAKVAMMPRAQGGEEIFPAALAMLRMIGGAVFFQAVVHACGLQTFPIPKKDHARLFGLGVLGIALNQVLFLFGLRWSSPFSVSLLGATIPVFTAVLAVLFHKEAFAWRTAIGLLLAAAGVVSLTGVGSLPGHFDVGVVLVTLNSIAYAAYVVLSRDIVLRLGALRVMAWVFTYAALVFAPIGLVATVREIPAVTTRGALYLAYIVAVPTILAYLLNAWALGRSKATIVTIYIVLQPLLAAVLARVQLGHTIASHALWAGLAIVLGLFIVTFRRADGGARAPS
jgi:drug/metabolite transporter (DMT)-like permease